MRCVVCPENGPPETLIIEDREERPPRPDQVVVDVAAAGVNFVDALFVAGSYQIKPPVPFVPMLKTKSRRWLPPGLLMAELQSIRLSSPMPETDISR